MGAPIGNRNAAGGRGRGTRQANRTVKSARERVKMKRALRLKGHKSSKINNLSTAKLRKLSKRYK